MNIHNFKDKKSYLTLLALLKRKLQAYNGEDLSTRNSLLVMMHGYEQDIHRKKLTKELEQHIINFRTKCKAFLKKD